MAGPEFGELKLQSLICEISIYGLNISTARCNGALLENLKLIGLCNSKEGPYLLMIYVGYHYENINVHYGNIPVFSKYSLLS